MKKLQHISDKMEDLRRNIESADDNNVPHEDLEVMKEELRA